MATVTVNKEELQEQLDQLKLQKSENQTLKAENQRILAENHRLSNEAQTAFNTGFNQGRIQEQAGNKVMEDIRMELKMQGCTSNIRPFGGESSEKFQMWLNDLERTLTQLGNNDESARALVLQTLKGPAADFVTREIRNKKDITWLELRKKLDERYNDMADMAYFKQKLKRMVQGKSESVQNFYERLMTTAKIAYGEKDMQDKYIQAELIETYVDGILDDSLAKRLIRMKFTSLDDALKAATQEQQAQKAFILRRGHAVNNDDDDGPSPMEVDHLVKQNPNASLQELRSELQELKSLILGFSDLQPSVNQLPVCFNCGQQGHIARGCRSPKNE